MSQKSRNITSQEGTEDLKHFLFPFCEERKAIISIRFRKKVSIAELLTMYMFVQVIGVLWSSEGASLPSEVVGDTHTHFLFNFPQ